MDPQEVAQDLQRSRERLRTVMLRTEDTAREADVFPRSATMRLLLDSGRRRWATMLLGGLASVMLGRRRRRKARNSGEYTRKSRPRALLSLLGSVLRR